MKIIINVRNKINEIIERLINFILQILSNIKKYKISETLIIKKWHKKFQKLQIIWNYRFTKLKKYIY